MFEELCQHMDTAFGDADGNERRLSYLDSEGDKCVIAGDTTLVEAIRDAQSDQKVLKILVEPSETSSVKQKAAPVRGLENKLFHLLVFSCSYAP